MLKPRIYTAIVVVALLLSALFWMPPVGWIAFCALCLGIAAWEWAALGGLFGMAKGVYVAVLMGAFAWTIRFDPFALSAARAPVAIYYAAAIFWLLFVSAWLSLRVSLEKRWIILAAGIAALVPAFAAMIDFHPTGRLLIAIIFMVIISDTAAYFTGRRFGRHKLAPAISPGKTWEGVLGAMLAVGIYGSVWALAGSLIGLPGMLPHVTSHTGWVVPGLLLLAAAGIAGDLFESLIKRRAGVKDSGTILPGHGGMLDRIDAYMPVLPLAMLLFSR